MTDGLDKDRVYMLKELLLLKDMPRSSLLLRGTGMVCGPAVHPGAVPGQHVLLGMVLPLADCSLLDFLG